MQKVFFPPQEELTEEFIPPQRASWLKKQFSRPLVKLLLKKLMKRIIFVSAAFQS